MINIRGHLIEVDILEELDKFEWEKGKVRGGKLLACSPFRPERRPSFAVNLENGSWIDSGGTVEEWKKGNLVKLLSWLRNESIEDTEFYLLSKYKTISFDTDNLELKINLTLEEPKARTLTVEDLKPFSVYHSYLNGRGITEKVKRAFKVGYSKKDKAITLPWFNWKGDIVNIKFRSVVNKRFWYMPECEGIANHVYGLHFVRKMKPSEVFIVEGEIDCMYLWSQGFPAIALGGANMTEQQEKLIKQLPIKSLVIATDNDLAGKKIRDYITERMFGIIPVREIYLPSHAKDVNDLSPSELKSVVNDSKDIRMKTIGI